MQNLSFYQELNKLADEMREGIGTKQRPYSFITGSLIGAAVLSLMDSEERQKEFIRVLRLSMTEETEATE